MLSLLRRGIVQLSEIRFAGWGYETFFGGGRKDHQDNVKLLELPNRKKQYIDKKLHLSRWPKEINTLGSNYFFEQAQPFSYYYHQSSSECLVGHPIRTKTEFHSNRTLTNEFIKNTTGFATQIVLTGRGVSAYWKDAFPDLYVRLGIGVKPIDLSRVLRRFAGEVNVHLNKRGTLITVHGFDKKRTGILTMYLHGIMRANAYTLKGSHLVFEPPKQKVAKKR